MPYKKINTELQQGVHNPPDRLYIKFQKIKLHSENLFLTPYVQTTHLLSVKTHEIVNSWTKKHNISYEKVSELVDLTNRFVDYLKLSEDDRKELFRIYRETQLVKLDQAIKALEKAMPYLWTDEMRLPDIYFKMETTLTVYTIVNKNLKKRKTGYHQLLYDMMIPLLDKLKEYGFSEYKIKIMLNDLLLWFDYDYPDVGKEILKYKKKEYFPDNIIKQIQDYLNNN